MKFRAIIVSSVLFLIAAVLIYSYIYTPLMDDVRVFFASAAQADFLGWFPFNVYRSWELKPVGNRFIIYVLYKIAGIFSDFGDKARFEIAVKSITAFFILMISAASYFRFKRNSGKEGVLLTSLLLIIFSLFSVSSYSALQAEYTGILVVFASLPFILSDNKSANYAAGFLLAYPFIIKGITVLFALQVFLIIYLIADRKLKRITTGFVASLVLIVLVMLVIFPQDLMDLYYATVFQKSFHIGLLYRTTDSIMAYARYFYDIPVIAGGVIAMFSISVLFLCYREWRKLTVLTGIWALGAVIVIMQGRGFSYYYNAFLIPACFSLYLLGRENKPVGTKINFLLSASLLLSACLLGALFFKKHPSFLSFFTGWLILAFVSAGFAYLKQKTTAAEKGFNYQLVISVLILPAYIWACFNAPWSPLFNRTVENSKKQHSFYYDIDVRYDISSQKTIMNLGEGIYFYYFTAPSYSRYFFPLPVQRALWNDKIKDMDVYKNTHKEFMGYKGDFVLHEPDFFKLKKFPKLEKKLRNEYEKVESSQYTTNAGVEDFTQRLVLYKKRI